jgi:hypothetical protein
LNRKGLHLKNTGTADSDPKYHARSASTNQEAYKLKEEVWNENKANKAAMEEMVLECSGALLN